MRVRTTDIGIQSSNRYLSLFRFLSACTFLMLASVHPAYAQQPVQAPAAGSRDEPACVSVPKHMKFFQSLPSLNRRLANKETVKIVALGSSSTAGAGASDPSRSYPARLEVLLREAYPGADIKVVNRGVGGDETRDEMLRFNRDVISERPDLVIWQAGTNTLLAHHDMWGVFLDIRAGINRLKAIGSDVILMNLQYAPKVVARANHTDMVDLIDVTGRETGVDVFDRYHIMKQWVHDERYPFEVFITADGLHMNDWAYDCTARLLSQAIVKAPSASSAAR